MMYSARLREKTSFSNRVASGLKASLPALIVVAFIGFAPVQAQTEVDTIEYQAKPYIQDGVAITSEAPDTTTPLIVVDEGDPNVSITTIQHGATEVREVRSRGRLLYVEVRPEGGVPYYIDHRSNLLQGHSSSTDPDQFRPSTFQITTW